VSLPGISRDWKLYEKGEEMQKDCVTCGWSHRHHPSGKACSFNKPAGSCCYSGNDYIDWIPAGKPKFYLLIAQDTPVTFRTAKKFNDRQKAVDKAMEYANKYKLKYFVAEVQESYELQKQPTPPLVKEVLV